MLSPSQNKPCYLFNNLSIYLFDEIILSPVRGIFYFLFFDFLFVPLSPQPHTDKMALIQDSKIYKDMYSLLRLILKARKQFDKFYRYSFAERMVMTAIDCCELLQRANSNKAYAAQNLNEFSVKYSSLRLMLMICRDEQQIDLRKFSDILELADSIGRQATGWRNSMLESQSPHR